DFDKPLADGLDVADAGINILQSGQQTQRGGGLAVVLPGRRDEHARCGRVFQRHRRFSGSKHSKERVEGSFTGQLLAGAGIKLAVFNGLDADDGGHAEDVVRVGAAGNVRGGPVQAKENLSVSVGARHVLNQFAGDVARVELGKNHHVGVSGNFAGGNFSRRDFRDQRGIDLQFAVEFRFQLLVVSDLS